MNIFRMGVQRVNGRRSARCPWFHLQVSRCSFCKGHSDHLCCAHTGFTLPATHGVQARQGVVKGIDRDFWKQRARGTVHYRGMCSEPDNLVLFLYRCPIKGTKAWLPWEGKKVTLHYSVSCRQKRRWYNWSYFFEEITNTSRIQKDHRATFWNSTLNGPLSSSGPGVDFVCVSP